MPIRLPDPFTHPGIAPGFKSAPLVDNEPLIQDELPNGQVLEVKTSAQYWSVDITYPELLEDEFRLIDSTIKRAKNSDGVITLALPQYLNLHVLGNTAATSILAGQTGSKIKIDGIDALQGRPYVGDLFQLKGETKVYKILHVEATATSWTLEIYPNLRRPTKTGDKPEFNEILFSMKLKDRSSFTENVTPDGLYTDMGLSLREVL